MHRLARLIDEMGLTMDDLWSYYELIGKPVWLIVMPLLIAVVAVTAALLF